MKTEININKIAEQELIAHHTSRAIIALESAISNLLDTKTENEVADILKMEAEMLEMY